MRGPDVEVRSRAMVRVLLRYLIPSRLLSAAAGRLYGAGVFGVPALYGCLALASVVSIVGYVRWDERHYG
jgi:hypothetical protein